MRNHCAFVLFLALSVSSCDVEEAPDLFHVYVRENETVGKVRVELTWTVNGKVDNGMIADMNIYVTRAQDMSDTRIPRTFSNTTYSRMDYTGGSAITLSNLYMFHSYRFYLGAAFNGILSPELVTWPVNLTYTMRLLYTKTGEEIARFSGNYSISQDKASSTVIEYPMTVDKRYIPLDETEPDLKDYSFRELQPRILIERLGDVVNTTSFPATRAINVDLLWRVNDDAARAYQKADLDLFAHDLNNRNVDDTGDLDDGSASDNSYEGFAIAADAPYMKPNVPESVGIYYYENMTSGPVKVDYLIRFSSLAGGKILRHVVKGTFTSPPTAENSGRLFFSASVTRSGEEFAITTFPNVIVWTP